MASEREDFSLSGPLHLTAIDWKNVHHRRSVAASLVQGVYVLERDRQKKREGPKALASPWWEFFDFQMVGQLIDDDDSSIFGAIYKFKPPPSQRNLSTDGCPRYVIAFRVYDFDPVSTGRTVNEIILSTFSCRRNPDHRRSVLSCLVQGAYVLETDRQKKREGPKALASPWWEFFNFQMIGQLKDDDDSSIFGAIYKFKPPASHRNLSTDECPRYVIAFRGTLAFRADHICSAYIGYFKHKKKMEEFGLGGVERLATQHSLRGLYKSAKGKEEREPIHRIPSANLTVNLTPSWGFKQAHGINQWWRPDLYMESVRY
ncbi:hypothetical protein Dsin_007936 [Dipteronia sinensis]|uniref:Uncharacterized protein n=1 Tax=Dipteronia sinensis TaxID=43782 RepID=A0AAE0B2F5_9ROSI|nr:hypothetical protein Dsin_007936 [Dipteronia sinensis]